MTAVRVFIVDDHEVVRDGLRGFLQAEADIEVVGEAATVAEAMAAIPVLRPDVTLLDLNLPDGNGVEVCRDLAGDPDLRFLVLSSVAEDEALLAAILAGAAGYVMKHVRAGELIEDIRRVARGEPLLDRRTREHVLERLRRSTKRPGSAVPGLSGQEQQVFDLLADGLTNRAIADHLGLAEKTVKNYVSNVLAKLGMARRTEVAVYAAELSERAKRPPRSDAGNAIRY
jgi:two-component system, NarL family, response regulator DevR